jgi:hypothetical protein
MKKIIDVKTEIKVCDFCGISAIEFCFMCKKDLCFHCAKIINISFHGNVAFCNDHIDIIRKILEDMVIERDEIYNMKEQTKLKIERYIKNFNNKIKEL